MHTKEKESLLKMVIAMAIKGYVYKPSQKRSNVIAEITNDLEDLEIAVDIGTVRKCLNAAKEIFPQKYH